MLQTPGTDVLHHAKPPYVLARLTAILHDSGLHLFVQKSPCPPPAPASRLRAQEKMRSVAGEKNLLSRNQHPRCFHTELAPAAWRPLLSSIPGPGTELCAARSRPTAGPDRLCSDGGTEAPPPRRRDPCFVWRLGLLYRNPTVERQKPSGSCGEGRTGKHQRDAALGSLAKTHPSKTPRHAAVQRASCHEVSEINNPAPVARQPRRKEN